MDVMYGSLASGSVDAVFFEVPLSGTMVRKAIGTQLASLTDPKNPARIVGRQHLRAVIASTPEIVAASTERAEQMVRMLQRSMQWIRKTPPAKVVEKLAIEDPEQAADIADAIKRLPNLYSPDGRFLDKEIQSTRQFLDASQALLPADFNIHSLIDDRWAQTPR
jgi:ABC-type nitrate/sulfonate/bicarbonate transport system substrate-binding protein